MTSLSAASSDPARVTRGVIYMLLSIAIFSVMDAIAKYLSASYPTVMIMWVRHMAQSLFVIMLVIRLRQYGVARSARPGFQLGRAACNIVSTFMFVFSLAFVPLADAIAISMAGPLMLTALSVPLLGEKVGIRRWSAVVVGCIGALIIVRPGLGVVHWAAMLFMAAAFLNAVFQIGSRKVSAYDSVTTTLFYTTVTGLVLTSIAVPFFWTPMPRHVWALLIFQGLLAGAAHLAQNKAFAEAPASVLAPLTYSALLFATTFGFVIFGDFPDTWTIVGALIVVASGLYVIYRERVRKRKREADTKA